MTKILIVTPAPPRSRMGNRVTAIRWKRVLTELGYRVSIDQRLGEPSCDLLLALHARKSAPAVKSFRQRFPQRPIVVALTGTDLYGDLQSSAVARTSLDLATRLVLLQPEGVDPLPRKCRAKARVIWQSAKPLRNPPRRLSRCFEISVCGHLRPVKDPFRAASAARMLRTQSRIRVTHVGSALSDTMARKATIETHGNSRYRWLGLAPPWKARRYIARSRVLVISSKMEGGANVVVEAVVDQVPVLASRISGNVGMLGPDYDGYFKPGSTRGLAELMERCEFDADYYGHLRRQCARRAKLFRPLSEARAWARLLNEIDVSP